MTRVAILVIAALDQPVYRHYIQSYWTEVIRHTNEHMPGIDVFLLLEKGTDHTPFAAVADNIIEDDFGDLDQLVERRFRRAGVPGILSKTIYGFEQLAGDYDLFFRTNLSSLIKLPAFEAFIRSRPDLGYSGAWVWDDALRSDLLHYGRVGPDQSITDLSELDRYPGNTFISGAGFFVNAAEAATLVERRRELRYDIPDAVAVGLMFARHEQLAQFALAVQPSEPVDAMLHRIRVTSASHIRFERFPVERAQQVWEAQLDDPVWR